MFRSFGSFSAILRHRHSPHLATAGVQRFGSAVVSQVQRDEVRSRPEGFPWRLVAAICVIRFPTLSREKTELEQRFEEMQAQKETERSVLSQYELERIRRTEEQRQYEEKTAEGEELDFEAERQRTAQQGRYEETDEIRELEEQEALSFQPASWADVNDDRHSLDRRLRDTLYLLVKKPRSGHAWQMPQGGHEGSESLRQTAQRELREECGSNVRVKFAGNVPCGFFGYRFPADHKPLDGMIGAKVFFFKAFYASGQVEVNREELEDYAWVTKEELKDYLSPEYYSAVLKFLSS